MMKMRIMKLAGLFGLERNKTGHLEKWISTLGGMAGMLAVLLISRQFVDATGTALVVASMGASAVLLFAVPHGPLSQPWPVLGGHTISAVIGVACAQWIPDTLLAASVAVALAIGAMHYMLCIHPPGGATALTAVVGGESFHSIGYHYVLTPVLLSAVAILVVAIVFNYPFRWRRYPAALANWSRQKTPLQPPLVDEDSRLTHNDFELALRSMNRVIDISGHDLKEIYQIAKINSRGSRLDPMQFESGQYYSNDHHGDFWQVRQIIDIASPAKTPGDKLICKVVDGCSLNTTMALTREEFSQWARYQVFQNNNSWLRIEGDAHILKAV